MTRLRAGWLWPVVIFVGLTAGAWLFFPGGPRLPTGDIPVAAGPVGPAEHINTRSWRTISRNPPGHAGERVILWGQVTQIGATPDGLTVRANVDAAHHTPRNGRVNYPTPVVMHGDRQTLHGVAQGNIFKAEVTIDGPPPDATGPPPLTLTVTQLKVTDKAAVG